MGERMGENAFGYKGVMRHFTCVRLFVARDCSCISKAFLQAAAIKNPTGWSGFK